MKLISKYSVIFLVVVIALAFSACSTATPHERLLGHLEKIINILYDNKEDPAKAAAAVKTYVDSNLEAIKTLVAESTADGSNPILTDSSFEERLMAVMRKHSELETQYVPLIQNPAVIEALAPVSEVFEASKAAQAKETSK